VAGVQLGVGPSQRKPRLQPQRCLTPSAGAEQGLAAVGRAGAGTVQRRVGLSQWKPRLQRRHCSTTV